MLRFTYTEMRNILLLQREKEDKEKISFIPRASGFPNMDFDQLLKQVSMSKQTAQTVIDMHCRNSFVSSEDRPTIGECQLFIKVMDVFLRHLMENRMEIKSTEAQLEKMLRTVLVVNGNKIISSSTDAHLNRNLKELTYNSKYIFTKDEPVFMEDI